MLCMKFLGSASAVNESPKERWQELCEQASIESNPEKLLELITEINRLLEAREAAAAGRAAESAGRNDEIGADGGRRGPVSSARTIPGIKPFRKHDGNAA